MRRETVRRSVASIAGVIAFVTIMWILSKELETWQAIALAATIAILNSILILWEKPNAKPKTIVIKVKAWDNEEVKIRALSRSEQTEILRLQLDDKFAESVAVTAHYAMVEPKMSYKEIIDIDWDKFNGVQEIAEATYSLTSSRCNGL